MDSLAAPEDLQQLMRFLECGAPRAVAMTAIGVSRADATEFMRLARAGESPHAELMESMVKAEALGECRRLVVVAKSKDWRANMTSLERQFPDKYGAKVQVEVKQELAKVFSAIEANTTSDQFEAILAHLAGSSGHGQDIAGQEEKQGPQIH